MCLLALLGWWGRSPLSSNTNSPHLLNTMFCCWVELRDLRERSPFYPFIIHFCKVLAHLPSLSENFSLFSLPPDLQRDLDFTFELDFKGQLCEAAIAHDYKMR